MPFLVALLLAGAALARTSPPDYRFVAANETNVWYLDAASVRREGGVTFYDVLYIHHSFARVGDQQPLYLLLRQQTRCEARSERTTRTTLVDTKGAPIFTSAGDPPWTPFLGEMGKAAFDYVCLGKSAAGRGAARRGSALEIATVDAARLAADSAAWLAVRRAEASPAAKD